MTAAIYDYDMPGREALVKLIQEAKPKLDVNQNNVDFGDPFYSPTQAEPGRTFIELFLLDRGTKAQFAYRRLDMAIAMGNPLQITVDGRVTTKNIVDEINRSRGFALDELDTDYDDYELAPIGTAIYYRMKAKPSSYVWYGETVVQVAPGSAIAGARLMEDESPRLMEAGNPRLLEEAP